ncbi:hypothetical protein NP493_451g01015 [Ridgeia piscesae]|uniref:Uncharacterized protein n=1 Tax=Ridgeia piscesae TaxID=27915 RepID=A0AAD9KZS3_RIDPI|nr:hypothetical protein NP493_451g01015 [Ridgeia piscesae]
MRKYNLLDERFMQLASNHEAMIQIKDEYKLQNAALRAENLRLQEANKHQFSPVIEQQNATIAALETLLDSTTKEKQEAESRCRELDELLNQEKDVHKREVDELREKLSLTEKQLSDKVSHLETELRNQRSADSTTKTHLEAVTKEKDELLDVIMRRGKLIQDKQTDIKHLQQKVETTERAMREMQEKFECVTFLALTMQCKYGYNKKR